MFWFLVRCERCSFSSKPGRLGVTPEGTLDSGFSALVYIPEQGLLLSHSFPWSDRVSEGAEGHVAEEARRTLAAQYGVEAEIITDGGELDDRAFFCPDCRAPTARLVPLADTYEIVEPPEEEIARVFLREHLLGRLLPMVEMDRQPRVTLTLARYVREKVSTRFLFFFERTRQEKSRETLAAFVVHSASRVVEPTEPPPAASAHRAVPLAGFAYPRGWSELEEIEVDFWMVPFIYRSYSVTSWFRLSGGRLELVRERASVLLTS